MAAVCVGTRGMEVTITGLLERDLSEGELAETIRGLREHGALRGEGLPAAMSGLLSSCNSRLISGSTRVEGLSLLALAVEESPTGVFEQHCVSWLRSILQIIQSQDPPRVVSLAVFVLRSLLAHSSALPELSREISTNHIPGLLTSLLGLRRQCLVPALEGIRSCFISYPRACGSLRGKLTAFLLSLIDAENQQIQEVACQCYSLLPSLGSGFSQGIKHTENWERQIQSVICSLHTVFLQLYQGSETDTARYEGSGTELELPPVEDDGTHSVLQLARRFTALAQCMRLLLREQFPAPVRVPVSDVLSLVCRVVNVSPKNLSWHGEESLKLLLLPRMHSSVLEILEATMIACGPRLLPFSAVICRLFPQLLLSWAAVKGMAGIPSGQERPYSSLRCSVYRVLETWVTMCGISSGVLQGPTHHSDILLANLLSDITPPTDAIKMSSFVQLGAKKQKVSEVGGDDFQSHRKRDTTANVELCTAALKGLCCVVLHCGSVIKEDVHRRLQELSIPLLLRLQQGPDQWLGPYTSSECRKELYRLLLCLTLTPNPRLPAPLHCAIKIFRVGISEESLQVSRFSTEALAICRILIHPRVPSLQRPLPHHGPRPPLQSDAPTLRPPAPPPTFPAMPPANHLPPRPTVQVMATEPPVSAAVPSPPPEESFGEKPRRAVFIHFDKEEPSDVEISLESDSDDSVVIVPEGLFAKSDSKPEPSPPTVKPTEEATEPVAQPAVPSSSTAPPPPPPPPPAPPVCAGPSSVPVPIAEAPPPPPPQQEVDTVININSSDDEEDGEEDEDEGLYDDEDEEDYYDEEEDEDLEGLEEDDYEEDEEGITEEEEEDLEEGEEDEEEGEDEECLMPDELPVGCVAEEIPDGTETSSLHEVDPDEGPPRLSPVQEDEVADTGLLMLVESEDRERSRDSHEESAPETDLARSPPQPPVLTPPPPLEEPPPMEEGDAPQLEVPELEAPPIAPEPEKEIEERKPDEVHVEKPEPEEEEPMADADTMLADFVDCPPDDDKLPEPCT